MTAVDSLCGIAQNHLYLVVAARQRGHKPGGLFIVIDAEAGLLDLPPDPAVDPQGLVLAVRIVLVLQTDLILRTILVL